MPDSTRYIIEAFGPVSKRWWPLKSHVYLAKFSAKCALRGVLSEYGQARIVRVDADGSREVV